MKEYIAAEGLDMYMCSLKRYEQALKNAGFIDIVSVQKYLSFEGFLAIK